MLKNSPLNHLLRLMGLDVATLALLLFKSWSIIASAMVIFFISLFLSPNQQGYYYTFTSLLALQLLFELGLGQVVIQFVSHEYALMGGDKNNPIPDIHSPHLGRLVSIVHLLRRWYAGAAVLFAFLVGLTGIIFFVSQGTLPLHAWLGPWLLLTLATAANLYLGSMLAVLQGCGKIAAVTRMQFTASVMGYLLMGAVFWLGGGLWAATSTALVASIYTLCWLSKKDTLLKQLQQVARQACGSKIHWRSEIFQMQWRIGVSWISGYFIVHLFIPLTFSKYGAVSAGQLGITMAIFNALTGISMSWIAAKNPLMGQHIALGQREQLNAVFRLVLSRSMAFVFLGIIGLFSLLALGKSLDLLLTKRFASLDIAACLAVVTFSYSFMFAAAAYLRAHKKEPLLCSSITLGVLTAIAAFISIRYSVLAMMVTYALLTVGVGVPWTLRLFLPEYQRTH